jgi:hypothetical protein
MLHKEHFGPDRLVVLNQLGYSPGNSLDRIRRKKFRSIRHVLLGPTHELDLPSPGVLLQVDAPGRQ